MMIVGPLKKWFFSRQIRKTPLVVAVSIVTKVVIGNSVRKPLFGVSMRRIHNVYLVHDDGSEALPLYCTNDKPPQRGGAAVPFPALGKVEMACQFPEGLILGRLSLGQFCSFFVPAVQCAVTYGQHS